MDGAALCRASVSCLDSTVRRSSHFLVAHVQVAAQAEDSDSLDSWAVGLPVLVGFVSSAAAHFGLCVCCGLITAGMSVVSNWLGVSQIPTGAAALALLLVMWFQGKE